MAEAEDIPPKYRLRRTRGIATVRDVADWLSWLGAKLRNSFKVEIEGANRSSYQADGMTHSSFEMQATSDGWVYVVIAQIVADDTIGSLPDDTGLFVAGIKSGGSIASQGDFQTYSQVINVTGGTLYREISTTLYASTLYPPATDPTDRIYRGDMALTIELVDSSDVVHDTFVVNATEGGTTFATEAPTDDETYNLRFASVTVTPAVNTELVKSNSPDDVFLNPTKKPFRLPAGGVLHAETLTALIKWVEASLTYKPPPSDVVTKKSTPSKPTYKIGRKGGFAYNSDAREIIKWLAKRMTEKV